MKPGFETTCICGTRLVWLRGKRGLVPIVKQYAGRVMEEEDIETFAHTREHEHSTLYHVLMGRKLLPAGEE